MVWFSFKHKMLAMERHRSGISSMDHNQNLKQWEAEALGKLESILL